MRCLTGLRVSAAVMLLLTLCAGRAEVKWLQTDYDFGTWHEAQGRRTGIARFVNTGKEAVAIISVRPSCGCTGADWYQEPVEPGDTAWVSFTYDPKGRPGKFEKTVKVYTDPGRVLQVITIRGTIVGTPETLERDYPVVAGPMRFTSLTYDFGKTQAETARHGFLKGYNQWEDTIRPKVVGGGEGLQAMIAKRGVAPGEPFTVGFYLSTRGLEPGAHSWPVRISCGKYGVNAEVTADIEPERILLDSAQMASACRIVVPREPVELTCRKGEKKAAFRFSVSNEGKDALRIVRVYSRAAAVKITRCPRSLKGGKTGTVEGYIDLTEIDGPAFGFIVEVITNDPLKPVSLVRVAGRYAAK